ncbi:MAG: hypothetical protein H6Q64_910 [Firmicutes bacterium]|nr:hypothetical protein [Bacillota bacterium]
MNDIQISGLVTLLIGLVVLLFCRRIVKFMKSFFSIFNIKMPDWIWITGLVIGAIAFICTGFEWIFR